MKSKLFGHTIPSTERTPFALRFAVIQEEAVAGTEELTYNARQQVSDFSLQSNKNWSSLKTSDIWTPVGNDPKDRIPDYNVAD